jgi:hypothetical protein
MVATKTLPRTPAGLVCAFYAVLLAIALVPVFSFDVLPLGDMPNHLARVFILNNLDADPDLQRYYATEWRFFAFQTTDFILPLLTEAFGLVQGARLFIGATFILLIGGTAALHRAWLGHVGLWPAAATLFLYSFPFALGQISFLFSTGLGLLLFAAWVGTVRRHGVVKILLFSAAGFALLICHFFAFAAYALMVGTFSLAQAWGETDRRRRWLDLIEAGLPFVLPVIVFLLSFSSSVHGHTFYGDILSKSVAVLSATLSYGTWPDIVVTVAVIGAVWVLKRRGRLSFAPGMRFPALVLAVTAVAMPRALQGVLGADLRIPCMLAFLLVASSDLALRNRRDALAFCAAVMVVLLFRVTTLSAQWRDFDADYREFRAADVEIERGSRVIVIPFDQDFLAAQEPRLPYWYVASLAVIDRSIFLPHLYTIATPLRFTDGRAAAPTGLARSIEWHPTAAAFAAADADTIDRVGDVMQRLSLWDLVTKTTDWSDWPEQYDYLIDLDFGKTENPVPKLLTEIRRGSYFTIYRIHPPR